MAEAGTQPGYRLVKRLCQALNRLLNLARIRSYRFSWVYSPQKERFMIYFIYPPPSRSKPKRSNEDHRPRMRAIW